MHNNRLHESMQDLEVNGFRAHPAAVDAATHFGAIFDTDALDAPRVPRQLEALNMPSPQRVTPSYAITS